MSTNRVTPIQLLRSVVAGKRPDPTKLLPGQAAVNTNLSEPGFYLADSVGTSLIKVGPVAVSSTAPNAGVSLSKGETWLDTAVTPPALKVYTGSAWVYSQTPTIIKSTAPALIDTSGTSYPIGTQWFNSTSGLLFVLYNDGTTTQWTQVSTSVVS